MTTNRPSVAVFIPTIGKSTVKDAVDSVLKQTYDNVHVHLVIDGPEYPHKIAKVDVTFFENPRIKITTLGENVGAAPGGPFYGHRVYAASPHISNADYICFLDEDNWYTTHHVDNLVTLCEENSLDFGFSLRLIFEGKEFVCPDRCESLGMWPIFGQYGGNATYLVDTSSFCFNRQFLMKCSYLWHFGWGADRRFFDLVKKFDPYYGTTARHTLCYRLEGNQNSVTKGFFKEGNKRTAGVEYKPFVIKAGGGFEWNTNLLR